MTPISEKLLKENGWLSLNLTWMKKGVGILYPDKEGNFKINGEKVEFMEQLPSNQPVEKKNNYDSK